jgi:hypothetical protein
MVNHHRRTTLHGSIAGLIGVLALGAAAVEATTPPSDTPSEPFTEAMLDTFLATDAADSLCELYYGELFTAAVVAQQYELNSGDVESVVGRVRYEVLYEVVETDGLRLTDEARERLFDWFDECEASMAGVLPGVPLPSPSSPPTT